MRSKSPFYALTHKGSLLRVYHFRLQTPVSPDEKQQEQQPPFSFELTLGHYRVWSTMDDFLQSWSGAERLFAGWLNHFIDCYERNPRLLEVLHHADQLLESAEEAWRPPSQTHGVIMFSREEVCRIIGSTGLRLDGHTNLPSLEWLVPPEQCFNDETEIPVEGVCSARPISPSDVYAAFFFLLRAFDYVESRQLRLATQANIEQAQALRKKLQSLIIELRSPRTKQISKPHWQSSPDGSYTNDRLLADCEKARRRYDLVGKHLQRQAGLGRDVGIEEFIRGPLAHWYERLFGQQAGGDRGGPFARFGGCIFEMLGRPIANATIVRATYKRSAPRAAKGGKSIRKGAQSVHRSRRRPRSNKINT